jgi:hypothetical protein
MVGRIATGEIEDNAKPVTNEPSAGKIAAASKGGKARTTLVGPKRRTEIARDAANSRWKTQKITTD